MDIKTLKGIEARTIVYFLKDKEYCDADILAACREPSLKLDENLVQLNIDNYNIMKEYKKR